MRMGKLLTLKTEDVSTCIWTQETAKHRIYNELNKQNTEGLFYRNDIGSKDNK